MCVLTLVSQLQISQRPQKRAKRTAINTYTIWNCHLLYLIVFLCLLEKIQAACYTSDKFSACQLCLNNDKTDVQSCLFNNNPNNSNCRSICCYYTYSISVPSSCNSTNSNGSSISISTIIIIVVFSIPVVICVILLIHSCVVGINRTPIQAQAARPRREERHAQSAINLQHFNMDQSFPYHIDRQQACSICLDSQCHIMTLCGHVYHSPCLRAWIKKKESCPLCVSQQYNPLGIFCTICGKSIRVNVMYSRMPSAIKIEWKQAVRAKCSNCHNAGGQQEIQISLGQQEIQRYQKSVVVPKRQIIPAESQQRVISKQIDQNNFP